LASKKFKTRGNTRETNPFGHTDANGNLIADSDRAGRLTRHTYDALNRRTQTIYPDGSTEHTGYDAVGRIAHTVDALGHVS